MADKNKLAKFDDLDLEGNDTAGDKQLDPKTLSDHFKFLKEKLASEDYSAAMKQFGMKTELSAEEILAELKDLIGAKKAAEDGGDVMDDVIGQIAEMLDVDVAAVREALAGLKKDNMEKKPKDDEEDPDDKEKMGTPDYKEFIQSEMSKGLSLKEAVDKWKDKYPEPDEKEQAEAEYLINLESRLAKLEAEKNMTVLEHKVSDLVKEQHLSPKQAEPIKQLANGMNLEQQDKLLNFFRETQKFNVNTDIGLAPGKAPKVLDDETRKVILEKHGLANLINEKGVRKDYSFLKEANN